MDRETIINEFLDRIENAINAESVDTVTERPVALFEDAAVTFDRRAARAALDRLFKDLKDFAGEK